MFQSGLLSERPRARLRLETATGMLDMPELPDLELYRAHIHRRVLSSPLLTMEVLNPFVLRSVTPSSSEIAGRKVVSVRRMGKRIVLGLAPDHFIVVHLMILGRFHWKKPEVRLSRRTGLAAWRFPSGTLVLTESGSKRRASIHLVRGASALKAFDPGGLEVLEVDLDTFAERLRSENHTLKRALTDPRLFSGIGNAYSDEILHHARLSPVLWTSRTTDVQVERLYHSSRHVLQTWIDRLREETGEAFPKRVTAYHPEMAVHGRHGAPCPRCGEPVQRIVYAENETNYCARCQTGGKLLADRALSRLLKKDWPRTLEELEARRQAFPGGTT